jgi:hypothetical protein
MENRKSRKQIITLSILLVAAGSIWLFSRRNDLVEQLYSQSFYPVISNVLRAGFGWIPFSIGDLLYAALIIYFARQLIRLITIIRKRTYGSLNIISILRRFIIRILLLYVVFNILWGLNYDRRGIAFQTGINLEKYTREELLHITGLLVKEVNACKEGMRQRQTPYTDNRLLFKKARDAYQSASACYPFLQYHHRSVKASFFGLAGNYLGFSGYYNPFTGEAQVNTTIPVFLRPYVVCHEMAHQLGYAKENEANFAGFLVATASGDTAFMYSAYLDLFLYASSNLRRTDSVAAKAVLQQLSPAVKEDMVIMKAFYKKYENPVEPVITWIYSRYLESNRQPSGMLSYSEVVAYLISYYNKYGKISGGK